MVVEWNRVSMTVRLVAEESEGRGGEMHIEQQRAVETIVKYSTLMSFFSSLGNILSQRDRKSVV